MRPGVLTRRAALIGVVALAVLGACGEKKPPVARPQPPAGPPPAAAPVGPATPIAEPRIVPPEPLPPDELATKSLDDLNRSSPLQDVFFEFDSGELTDQGRQALDQDAGLLKRYTTWTVSIEGHCDERGTAEYNLALGERRSSAAKAYLVSLGVAPDRLKTVSYGKEFPFDPAHSEEAWAKNRRAHFVITAK